MIHLYLNVFEARASPAEAKREGRGREYCFVVLKPRCEGEDGSCPQSSITDIKLMIKRQSTNCNKISTKSTMMHTTCARHQLHAKTNKSNRHVPAMAILIHMRCQMHDGWISSSRTFHCLLKGQREYSNRDINLK